MRHTVHPVERRLRGKRDTQAAEQCAHEADHERHAAARQCACPELVTDDRELTQRRVEHPLPCPGIAFEDEAQAGHEHHQQREQAEEGVVGDQCRQVAALVLTELLDDGNRQRERPVPALKPRRGAPVERAGTSVPRARSRCSAAQLFASRPNIVAPVVGEVAIMQIGRITITQIGRVGLGDRLVLRGLGFGESCIGLGAARLRSRDLSTACVLARLGAALVGGVAMVTLEVTDARALARPRDHDGRDRKDHDDGDDDGDDCSG